MQKYKCHKVVEAEILSSFYDGVVLESGEEVKMTSSQLNRIAAMARDSKDGSGYLVKYEDGYLSWSPKDVFEAGYSKI